MAGGAGSRAPWQPPADGESVERVRFGPFLTREVVRRPDGSLLVYTSRRQRKGLGPRLEGAGPPAHRRVVWAPGELGWWVAVLFLVGAGCFAVGALPGLSSVASPELIGVVFFVGSLFFTSAGYAQFLQSINAGRPEGTRRRLFAVQPRRIDWWACGVQSVGTLWFNVNTFEAMQTGFTTRQELLRVWTPDFVGSICFLVASELAIIEVCQTWFSTRDRDVSWWIVMVNMVGSVFFMISAVAAFVRPDTGDLLDATMANTGTFLGAACFFAGARLLLDELAQSEPAPSGQT
ncbi:MAG: YrhK family protein [Acidimicrobiales bacterium]|nr:YrhK family protein [Acidimicrobiales bacterium]MCB9371699.1 YrhK family protein [Microthrixaceae bacterium]